MPRGSTGTRIRLRRCHSRRRTAKSPAGPCWHATTSPTGAQTLRTGRPSAPFPRPYHLCEQRIPRRKDIRPPALQDVMKGIVKPGVALGDQHARAHCGSEQGSRPGGNPWRGRRSPWFGRARHPSDRRCPLAILSGPERDDILRHRLTTLYCGVHAGSSAR